MDYTNWYESVDKWVRIYDKVRAREPFTDYRGWGLNDQGGLRVLSCCGYCKEFERPGNLCGECTLKSSGFCSLQGDSWHGKRSVFWRFVEVMQILSKSGVKHGRRYRNLSEEELWSLANQLSFQMLERIRKDDPRRPQP